MCRLEPARGFPVNWKQNVLTNLGQEAMFHFASDDARQYCGGRGRCRFDRRVVKVGAESHAELRR